MVTNKCHSIYNNADVNWICHTVDEETTVIDHHDYSRTNNTDTIPKHINDLDYESTQLLNKSENRLILNIRRLLINLKDNNATEISIEMYQRHN